MNQRNKSDVAWSSGAIQTGVVIIELTRSALQTLVREQYTIVQHGDLSVLFYINGGNIDALDIGRENDVDGKCNVSIDSLGRLLRGDTVYWGDTGFNGRPMIIDSAGANLDLDLGDEYEENLLNKHGWS